MFELELYCDDSGTDAGTPIAVAACYVAGKKQWDEFVRNWDEVRGQEGFDFFHMAEFVAKPEMGHKPFCDWDNRKKERVYYKLASIINTRVSRGFAIAVPKQAFDDYAFPEFRQFAENHYVWAAKSMIGLIAEWRKHFAITAPMKYVFESGTLGEDQLRKVWTDSLLHKHSEQIYGIVPEGVMFQSKKLFKPLQAADILAWQSQNFLRRSVMIGRDPTDESLAHPGFLYLRKNRPMNLGFYSREQMRMATERAKSYHEKTGLWPWQPEAGQYFRATSTDPGMI